MTLKVELIEHTPNPERTIAAAARICYAPIGPSEMFNKLTKDEVAKMVRLVRDSGHLSAIEHATFSFSIEGISRTCSHQIVRHRLASFNQQSQRYVKYKKKVEFITPPSIKKDKKIGPKYAKFMENAFKLYGDMLDAGIAAEDARFIFPQAVETKLIMTMNARELMHFFTLRCCDRAQWEIRKLAIQMLKIVKKTSPVLFENCGPYCVRIPCPEGKFYCGKPWKKENAAPSSEKAQVAKTTGSTKSSKA